MSAVPFDTLKFARHLEASGLAPSTAAAASEALADAMIGADLATKNDIALLRDGTKSDIAALRQELKTDNAALRQELKSDITALRDETKSNTAALRDELNQFRSEHKSDIAMLRLETKSDIELARRDITIKLGSMIILGVGVILAAMRYLPLHP